MTAELNWFVPTPSVVMACAAHRKSTHTFRRRDRHHHRGEQASGRQDLQRAQGARVDPSPPPYPGYGSAVPGQRGQVVLDLRKMNKIIHVDLEPVHGPGRVWRDHQMLTTIRREQDSLMLSLRHLCATAGPLATPTDRGVGLLHSLWRTLP